MPEKVAYIRIFWEALNAQPSNNAKHQFDNELKGIFPNALRDQWSGLRLKASTTNDSIATTLDGLVNTHSFANLPNGTNRARISTEEIAWTPVGGGHEGYVTLEVGTHGNDASFAPWVLSVPEEDVAYISDDGSPKIRKFVYQAGVRAHYFSTTLKDPPVVTGGDNGP